VSNIPKLSNASAAISGGSGLQMPHAGNADAGNAAASAAPSRWLVAIMGTVLQVVLGSIYSWSYF